MKFNLLGKRLLFVTAHPDDESYLAAGTIAQNKRAGGKSTIVCATLGEKGKAHIGGKVTQIELKAVRHRELKNVSHFLGVTTLCLLRLPDGKLRDCANQIYHKVLRLIQKHQPEVLVSFGPDGITGHLDHITVGTVTARIATELSLPFVAFVPPPAIAQAPKSLHSRRKHGVYSDSVVYPKANVKIKIDPDIKLRALHFHRSQIPAGNPFHGLPTSAAKQMLHYEYYHLAGTRRKYGTQTNYI